MKPKDVLHYVLVGGVRLDDMDWLMTKTKNILFDNGYSTISDVLADSVAEIRMLNGMNDRAFDNLCDAMREYCLGAVNEWLRQSYEGEQN